MDKKQAEVSAPEEEGVQMFLGSTEKKVKGKKRKVSQEDESKINKDVNDMLLKIYSDELKKNEQEKRSATCPENSTKTQSSQARKASAFHVESSEERLTNASDKRKNSLKMKKSALCEQHEPSTSSACEVEKRLAEESQPTVKTLLDQLKREKAINQQLMKQQKEAEKLEKEKQRKREKAEKQATVRKSKVVMFQPSDDPTVRALQCDVCFRTFKTMDKKQRHERSHSDEPECYCSLCGVPIKYKYNLKHHMTKCQAMMREQTEQASLEAAYPELMTQIKAATLDPSVPLPTLKGYPYKMDRHGFVTGFDKNLDVKLDKLIPNYNPNLNTNKE